MSLFSLRDYDLDLSFYSFISEYHLIQSEAIAKSESREFIEEDIHFNSRGNVNMAKTITFPNNQQVIIELGSGRLKYEK